MVTTSEVVLERKINDVVISLVLDDSIWQVCLEASSEKDCAIFKSKDDAILDYLKKVHYNS